ncbi:hypothetical protein [Phyllobacterium sp. OV277]|uniref:hypothetical protein n=1 Tax=Phyllobacterium sp. OV277 TaxID=1882772 RepID=UPI00088BF987|nr:hypothetical protein [Phyllobacterium sp. OV277]SDP09085.1 hypothetical protein SAMN05443582_103375 [Phyllobacterium sp. OV277]
MARIRSVHPGLSTDEAYMQMSAFAKAALPLLWTECDDQGVFEWKPVVLKARILPADSVDFSAILGEYEALGAVLKIDVEGKNYGLVRNFQKYQRPKKPNEIHPLPNQYRTFVGSPDISSEPVPHQLPTGSENSPQMEDEGGRMKEEGGIGSSDNLEPRTNVVGAKAPSTAAYAFEGRTIKLNQKDLDQWKKAYPHLSLEAELLSLDDWAGKEKPKNWFAAVSGALNKKNRAAHEAIEKHRVSIQTPNAKTKSRTGVDSRL